MKSIPLSKSFKDLVLLFFLTLVVFWPLSLNYLSLKNDALVYFIYRYHLSEAIHSGYLPFWSPYFYTGFPIHADIQGGIWNPVALVLSLLSRYNMTVLQWEVLIYLFLSAVGMYRLIKHLALSRITAICSAAAFMSCGYMVDSISIIPWVASAAFVPFVLLYFLRLLKSILISDAIKLSIALSLMFLCGYPSFFIFLNYIIVTSFLIWLIYQIKNKNSKPAIKLISYFGITYLLFLLLCSPAIISYYEFLPYYSRGSGLNYETAITNPLVPFSLITFVLPNIANKADFLPTDLSMRNAYIGLFVFLFFLISMKNLSRIKVIILVFTLYSVLFSLGDLTFVQKLSYQYLPLMNMFRHPGTMRLFTSIGIVILAAFALDIFFRKPKENKVLWLSWCMFLLFCVSIIYFIATGPGGEQIHFSASRAGIKQFLHGVSFQKFAAFISTLQIAFILAFLLLRLKKVSPANGFALIIILNSVVFAWIGLPFTAVSQYKVREVNNYFNSFAKGYPLPDVNASVGPEVYSDSSQISVHGYSNFYNKTIAIQDHIVTPTLTSDYYRFLENDSLRQKLKTYPFVYVTDNACNRQPAKIDLLKFTPNKFYFQISGSKEGQLQLFQQYNINWHVKVNGHPATIERSNTAFMSVTIPSGTSLVEWKYYPKNVFIGIILSVLTMLIILLYFVLKRKAETNL